MSTVAAAASKLPPMLLQYLDYKGRYPDALLFFQVGDFYELFFEDAITVSKVLNLTLTSRDKNSDNPVPMCGVPIGVIEGYIDRLLAQRFSVALVSQKEIPEGHKGPVERSLDRIVTPGIQILSHSQGGRAASYVAAVALNSLNELSIAYSEVQSGRIAIRDGGDLRQTIAELQRISPAELILPTNQGALRIDRRQGWIRELELALPETSLRFRNERSFESDGDRSQSLARVEGYAGQSPLAKRSIRILADYIEEVTVGSGVPLIEVSLESDQGVLLIDSMTRINLEVVRNSRDGGVEGSLYHYINSTVSSGGSKLLREWLLAPLANSESIRQRQQAVSAFVSNSERARLRDLLSQVVDGERIAVRVELQAVTPRELAALRDTLQVIPEIRQILLRSKGSSLIEQLASNLSDIRTLQDRLSEVLEDEPPLASNYGGIIRHGVDVELDRLRGVATNGKAWIEELEASEKSRTGIPSLKIKYTGVFGYFIEVTNSNLAKVPTDYIRKQTTANSERFVTEELKRRELEIVGADDRAILRERQLFLSLRDEVCSYSKQLRDNARILSQIDVVAGLAELAEREGYVAPDIDDSNELEIIDGKHPVLHALLRNDFIANSIAMGETSRRCFVVTGPNMGGKSTFLRQTALLVILAQIGSFIPAKRARIGVVDKIFARLGASDNLREGESTFMVEMREASTIVANASQRSLVLIDEIGRGTATLDGLALAQAILEWMAVKAQARVLFATHFHELTLLDQVYPSLKNLSVGSEDRGKSIIFTHRIVEGPASRSYGIEVAERAGLPAALMRRARALHAELIEKENSTKDKTAQLSLFQVSEVVPDLQQMQSPIDSIRERIKTINVNGITPLEALTIIAQLQGEILEENR